MQNTKYKIYGQEPERAAALILPGSAAAVRGPSPSVGFADISPAPQGSLPLPLR
ncbi:MAG: hypothetical protein IK104_04580 [Clostridia bacterium]|nr:hypothetical protein [Clostridia bacterium]